MRSRRQVRIVLGDSRAWNSHRSGQPAGEPSLLLRATDLGVKGSCQPAEGTASYYEEL